MRAIVLAAGTGSRLGDRTTSCCKGMIPVNGKLLIDYLLDFFEINFFDEILVIGGFHYAELKEHIDKKNIKKIKVCENREFLKGNIYTLIRGLKEFSNDSFLITNTDHIYPKALFQKMKLSMGGITAMCDFDRQLSNDDMKVKLRHDGISIGSISKKLDKFDCGYIGMTYVDKTMNQVYVSAVDKALATYGEKAVVENALQILAEDEKTAPKICDLSGIGWYEVDTVDDLKNAEKGLLTNRFFR
jgi:L-glutamine-phosphate cytidylyltransferase